MCEELLLLFLNVKTTGSGIFVSAIKHREIFYSEFDQATLIVSTWGTLQFNHLASDDIDFSEIAIFLCEIDPIAIAVAKRRIEIRKWKKEFQLKT